MATENEKKPNAVAPTEATGKARVVRVTNSGYGDYGANVMKRSLRGWRVPGGSPKEDIEDNIEVLRKRSRDAYMGIPIAAGAIKTLKTNVVCSGLMPTPQVDVDYLGLTEEQADRLQSQIVREFNLWADSPLCDADRVDDFWELQMLAFTGFAMNGDAFALLPYNPKPGRPYGLQVRLLEADRVCSPDNYDRLYPCIVNGYQVNRIVQGVETDASGAVVAYWVCNRHPLSSIDDPQLEWTRVEAYGNNSGRRNILHIMQRERAGQRRGVPLLAPVLESLKQLGRYTEAELNAALIAASVTVMIERENASEYRPFGEQEAPSDLPQDEAGIELAPAAVFDLAPGEKANMLDPKHPTTTFDGFVAAMSKQIAAALEIPSEVLYKQFQSNYSASRGALNEFWRTCGMYRDNFASDFCQPVYEAWFAEAVALGRIAAPGFFDDPAIAKAYTNCTWNGPARTNLNPKDEIEAAILRAQSGVSTYEQETAQMTGGSFAANMRQRKSEIEKAKEAGGDEGQNQNSQSGE